MAVPRLGVGAGTATTLALVIHELATNSLKHGALSIATGALDISSTTDGADLILIWAETGGPPIRVLPRMVGFGSRMISRSVSQQFDGALSYDWQSTGLVATLQMNKERLAH